MRGRGRGCARGGRGRPRVGLPRARGLPLHDARAVRRRRVRRGLRGQRPLQLPDSACTLSARRFVEHAGSDSGACVARSCETNPVAALAAGGTHACLRRLDGTVACWGRNDDGQLGDGTRTPRARAAAVSGLRRRDRNRQRASAHLRRAHGRLGRLLGHRRRGPDRRQQRRATPDAHNGRGHDRRARGRRRRRVSRARWHDGSVICWGTDDAGQLGDGAASATARPPTPVVGRQPRCGRSPRAAGTPAPWTRPARCGAGAPTTTASSATARRWTGRRPSPCPG